MDQQTYSGWGFLRVSLPVLLPCSATARAKEQCRCQIARLSSAHTPNPPTAPAALHSWHHLHIKVADIYEWTRLTTQYRKRGEMDLIELWLLAGSFAWMFSCGVRRRTVSSRALGGGGGLGGDFVFATKWKALICSQTTHSPPLS